MNSSTLNILLYIVIIILPVLAQLGITINYGKYKKVENKKGLTGFDVAKKILEANGLDNIYVV